MRSLLLISILLFSSTIIGIYNRKFSGQFKHKKRFKLTVNEINYAFGSRATILQFSTTFCSSCSAAKTLIEDVIKDEAEISYYEVDAVSNLELVRKFDVRSTPTTLIFDSEGFEIARANGTPKRDQLIKVVASL